MNYMQINKNSIAEMPGVAVTLFISGCLPNKCPEGNCPGCHNPESHKFTAGQKYTEETKNELFSYLDKSYISGLCLCGGEIYDQPLNELLDLVKSFRLRYGSNKKLWYYTGYEWYQIKDNPLTVYADVVVVGRFELDKRDISDNNRWRGSTNQRVVDVTNSLLLEKQVNLLNIPNNN